MITQITVGVFSAMAGAQDGQGCEGSDICECCLAGLTSTGVAQKPDVGKAEYLSSCAVCHGTDAKGKGSLAGQLKAAPADLTQLAKKNGGVFPLNAVYEKIDGRQDVKAHGPRDMPIWGLSILAYSNGAQSGIRP
jgi:mono/diheme cytochrome c family protein